MFIFIWACSPKSHILGIVIVIECVHCLDWSVRPSIHPIVHTQSSISSHSLPSPLSPPSQQSQMSLLSPSYTPILQPFTHLLHAITPMLHPRYTLLHALSGAVHKWRHHVLGVSRHPPPFVGVIGKKNWTAKNSADAYLFSSNSGVKFLVQGGGVFPLLHSRYTLFHYLYTLFHLGMGDTQSDSIQCLNFAKKWFIQYSIKYCFTQD